MNVDLTEQSRNSTRNVICSCCKYSSRKGLNFAELYLLWKIKYNNTVMPY